MMSPARAATVFDGFGASPGYAGGCSAVAKLEVATCPHTASIMASRFCWNAVARAASICAAAWRYVSRSARDRTGGSLSARESSLRRGLGTGRPGSGSCRVVSAGTRVVSAGTFTVSFAGSCASRPAAPTTIASETDKTRRCINSHRAGLPEFTVAAGSQSDEPPVYFTP